MATSNLISKSLGDILTESGNGTPSHISPKGSMYVDLNTAIIYVNIDGLTNWVDKNKISHGNEYTSGNATAVTGVVINTWYPLSGATWTSGIVDGTSKTTTDKISINSGFNGKYLVYGCARFNRQTANAIYQIGISKNDAVPSDGYYSMASTDSTETTSNANIHGYFNLVGGDTIQLVARNITTTNNILVSEASLTLIKIGN